MNMKKYLNQVFDFSLVLMQFFLNYWQSLQMLDVKMYSPGQLIFAYCILMYKIDFKK